MQRSKFTGMINIHLRSCVLKIIKKNPWIFVKVIVKKSVASFLCGHGVDIGNNLASECSA